MIETDEELRKRLIYVAGDTPEAVRRIDRATGAALSAIAETMGLRRRGSSEPQAPRLAPGWYAR